MIPRPYKIYIAGDPGESDSIDGYFSIWNELGATITMPLHPLATNNCVISEFHKVLECDGVQFVPGWELSPLMRMLFVMADEGHKAIYLPRNGILDVDSFRTINGIAKPHNINHIIGLCHAIKKVFHVSIAEIRQCDRYRMRFFARMAFAHECRKVMPMRDICALVDKPNSIVRSWLRNYENEISFHNSNFGKMMGLIQGWENITIPQ